MPMLYGAYLYVVSKVESLSSAIEKRLPKGSLFSMVGVKGLKPSTSRSQTGRAINCATPRWCFTLGLLYTILLQMETGIIML